VVVELSGAEFGEGQVLSVHGEQLRVQILGRDESSLVPVGDVYVLPPAGQRHLPNDLAICGSESGIWVACRIVGEVDGRLRVVTSAERELVLEKNRVLDPSPVTELNLRRHFELLRAKQEFVDAARRAGLPRIPAGFQPKVGERVVAPRRGDWYGARVKEVSEEGISVEWQGRGEVEVIPPSVVAPEPPYVGTPFVAGQFALQRPETPGARWRPVVVRAVGQEGIKVADITGAKQTVSASDLVPLGREP
jgi:hypothetical protein